VAQQDDARFPAGNVEAGSCDPAASGRNGKWVVIMRGPLRGWRARKALRAASMLDEIVDSQLPLLAGLPEASRRRSAGYLAELVMLAQAYRHFATGWLDRRELEQRSQLAMRRLSNFRHPHPSTAQFTEQD
jgi:hypothetical protein